MAFARVIDAILSRSRFTVLGSGEQSRDFTYVGDAVAATVVAEERAATGAVYNVGGGNEATLLQVIAVLERLCSRKLDVRFEPVAAGDVARTAADTRRIRAELGWRPETTLEQGLAAQVEYAAAPV
jgi:nucleoside-diphosphate-sugar epimerase